MQISLLWDLATGAAAVAPVAVVPPATVNIGHRGAKKKHP